MSEFEETLVTRDRETLTLYLMTEENEMTQSSVSVGHMAYRAHFYFKANEPAKELYELLKTHLDEFEID